MSLSQEPLTPFAGMGSCHQPFLNWFQSIVSYLRDGKLLSSFLYQMLGAPKFFSLISFRAAFPHISSKLCYKGTVSIMEWEFPLGTLSPWNCNNLNQAVQSTQQWGSFMGKTMKPTLSKSGVERRGEEGNSLASSNDRDSWSSFRRWKEVVAVEKKSHLKATRDIYFLLIVHR